MHPYPIGPARPALGPAVRDRWLGGTAERTIPTGHHGPDPAPHPCGPRPEHRDARPPPRRAANPCRWRLLGCGLALLVSGCAHRAGSPELAPDPAADLPLAWSATGAATPGPAGESAALWWRHFQDGDLAPLVARAMQANTTVLGAQAALRQARALRDAAVAGLQPTLDSAASATQGWRARSSTGNSFQLGLDAGWELDVFGARRSAVDTGQASARASAASLGDVQLSIAAEVALTLITLRSTQARLAIAQANLDSQLQTLRLTDWRAQAGLLSTLEVEQARAASAQTQAQLPVLQTAQAQAQAGHALAVLTGQPPAALAGLVARPAPVPQPRSHLALSLPADTLRQRLDVRAAEQQVLAAAGRVAQADAARRPHFRLGGSLGLNALTLSGLGHSAAVVSTLLASTGWTLWDGGAGRAQVRAQEAALDQARATYRSTVLRALQEVEDALVSLRGDRERGARLQQAATAAAQAARLARLRYDSGLVDFRTVLDTQRTQLGTQDGLATALADVSADHVRLFKALGGGWQPDDAPAPSSPTEPGLPPR